ncbi:glycosyltransferase family 2 protein [Isoptericola sp. b441]|uniref:Glycosyltransferase family 2 protein n=1 Tax=Actinotalea lenta TaxID=3064654 RepID=A0ABT9DF77_9CELL|nr:glycosyltransferase family 2 protein [Isoptericola sp. b441]MDO8108568.1 glycosyltransferase family 2 protein [Isoptericola sp. b441]
MSAPEVRVVCVTYHPGPELDEFASSLADATRRPVELVLVDNGTDATVAGDVAARHGAQLLVAGRNLGYGGAANLGAAGSSAPWIVVANPDVVWAAGALDALLDGGLRHPGAGALGPRVLNPDGTTYPSARALPGLGRGIGHALLGRAWPGNPWTSAYLDAERADPDAERTAGWLSGSCLLLRRAAFEQVGGFDDGYFMFFEDVDLGDRLGRAGWSSVFVPSAVVTHAQGTSWRERPEAMIRAHHASAARYLARRYPRWYQWPVRTALRIGLQVRAAIQVRRSQPS